MLTPMRERDPVQRSHPDRRPRGLALLGSSLLAALLVACGGTQQPGIALSLSSSSAEVVRGGSVQVLVDLSRQGGASETVTLGLAGSLPANVSASFNPTVLSGAASQSTLTIQAEAGAAVSTTGLSVTAVSGGLEDSAALSVEVVSLELNGRVSGPFGLGMPGVLVSSQGQNTVSTADGSFSLSGLSIPYDLALSTAVDDGALHVFAGLSTAEPDLAPGFGLEPMFLVPSSAMVSGDLLGGDPLPANHGLLICVEGLEEVVLGCEDAGPGDTAYTLNPAWLSSDDVAVRIHAVHYEHDASGRHVAYHGYADHELTLSDGDAISLDLALGEIGQGTMPIQLASEGGLVVTGALVGLRFGPNLLMLATQIEPTDVDVLLPVRDGLSYEVIAVASSVFGFAWQKGFDLEGGTVTMPSPPALLTPSDGTTGVDGETVFSVAAPAGRAKLFLWQPDAVGPRLFLTTTENSATLPDPTPYGLTLPAGADYEWQVISLGVDGMGEGATHGSLSAFSTLLIALSNGGPGPAMDGAVAPSVEARDVQTAP